MNIDRGLVFINVPLFFTGLIGSKGIRLVRFTGKIGSGSVVGVDCGIINLHIKCPWRESLYTIVRIYH